MNIYTYVQATGYRLQATGYRLQATGYRLQATPFHYKTLNYLNQAFLHIFYNIILSLNFSYISLYRQFLVKNIIRNCLFFYSHNNFFTKVNSALIKCINK